MTIRDFDYLNTDEQYNDIRELIMNIPDEYGIKLNWDVGRLDWWRYYSHASKDIEFFKSCAHVWKDGKKTIGLFISEYNRNDFFIVVHPDYYPQIEQIIRWVEDNWTEGKDKIETYIFEYRKDFIRYFTAKGLVKDGHESNVRGYNLEKVELSYTLPKGFEIKTFAEYGDFDGKIELIKNAFNKDVYPREKLESFLKTPGYTPEMDLVVIAPNGDCAAYCTGWEDLVNDHAGYIEPMGTHSNYRRLGLAKALARECFQRLRKRGVIYAEIAAEAEPNISNFLYESLDPFVKYKAYRYSLFLNKTK